MTPKNTAEFGGGVCVGGGAVRPRPTQRVLTAEDKSCRRCNPFIKSRQRSEHLSTDRHTPETVTHTTWRGHSQTDTPNTHTFNNEI